METAVDNAGCNDPARAQRQEIQEMLLDGHG
jgi:hypothetical protein